MLCKIQDLCLDISHVDCSKLCAVSRSPVRGTVWPHMFWGWVTGTAITSWWRIQDRYVYWWWVTEMCGRRVYMHCLQQLLSWLVGGSLQFFSKIFTDSAPILKLWFLKLRFCFDCSYSTLTSAISWVTSRASLACGEKECLSYLLIILYMWFPWVKEEIRTSLKGKSLL